MEKTKRHSNWRSEDSENVQSAVDSPNRSSLLPDGFSVLEVMIASGILALGIWTFAIHWERNGVTELRRFAHSLKIYLDQASQLSKSIDSTVEVSLQSSNFAQSPTANTQPDRERIFIARSLDGTASLLPLSVPSDLRITARFANPHDRTTIRFHSAGDSPGSVEVALPSGEKCKVIQSLHSGRRIVCEN